VRTALVHKSHLGSAEICHPFHPLHGQRFEVLKERRLSGVDTLILRILGRGTFSVPREWTDWAYPSNYNSVALPPRRFDADSLLDLVALLDQIALTGNEKKD
jgi:Family of unknown function (DUF5372)